MTPKETIAKSPSGRVKRTRIGSGRYLPQVTEDPDYVYRFVNDRDDRIHQFKQAGYEPVDRTAIHTRDIVGEVPSSLGSQALVSVGQGDKALLMRTRREYYEEDQAEKQAIVDRSERAMKEDMRRNADYGKYGKDTNIE